MKRTVSLRPRTHFEAAGSVVKSAIAEGAGAAVGAGVGPGSGSGFGSGVAVAIGVPMAMAVAFSAVLRRTFYPLAVALEMVPKIAFAPLFVTWFGFGIAPKVIIVFLVCFFPILLNGILAFSSLPAELGRLALSTGAGRPLKSVTKDMRWSVGASVTAEQRRDHEVYDL